jgi:hypothetical protein
MELERLKFDPKNGLLVLLIMQKSKQKKTGEKTCFCFLFLFSIIGPVLFFSVLKQKKKTETEKNRLENAC